MAFGRKKEPAPDLGYKRGFAEKYEVLKELGKGGNGVVRLARHKENGRSFAVKSIPKVLTDPAASERKKAGQIPYLKREVEVLLALRGTLNVANLEEVYEDDVEVHLVLELCSGGELLARTKSSRHYSERTAASFLRAVLRTVAQCHAKRIIHRDIKPENFLLLSEDNDAPLKAIDFGLSVFFDPAKLPVTGLNPEGTPWYLAPECCRAKWYPVSDVWSVGIMACYLLTGAYPFLDRVSPKMPDLARTLRSICFEDLDLGRKEFEGLSEDARAFITALLIKDPAQRPSAEEVLRHPFLRGSKADRSAGKPLDKTVVQRIQRFAQNSLFKRTVLEHIAADLLSMHFSVEPSVHGASVFRERSVRGGRAFAAAERSVHGGGLGGNDRSFRGLASAALAAVRLDRSVHGSYRGRREGSSHSLFGGSVRGSTRDLNGLSKQERVESLKGKTLDVLSSKSLAAASPPKRPERGGGGGDRSVHGALALSRMGSAQLDPSVRSASMYLPVATPYSHRLAQLLDQLQAKQGESVDPDKLQKSLKKLGYHLREEEVQELFGVVDVGQKGEVSRAELAAGLIDWKAFQDTYKDRWLECARRAFADLDKDGSGELGIAEIASAFGSHLTPYEVDAAVHQALLEATGGAAASTGDNAASAVLSPEAAEGTWRLDFDHFLQLLRDPSTALDDLDLTFDDRLSNHTSRQPSLWADDMKPVRAGGGQGGACCTIM